MMKKERAAGKDRIPFGMTGIMRFIIYYREGYIITELKFSIGILYFIN